MKITYTRTDEAPALATYSLLPILQAFAGQAGVTVETCDISLAARVLAAFDLAPDALAELAELTGTAEANIVKLPNVSATVPQLKVAIAELQEAGFAVPDYPVDPADNAAEREVLAAYAAVQGSAVNPVLRQGNSDRRAPAAVKQFARRHPHSMDAWPERSRSNVSTMSEGDFRGNEQSLTMHRSAVLRLEHVAPDGVLTMLKAALPVQDGEIIDTAVMRKTDLERFLQRTIADARGGDVLFSVHLKATMMKVSDPIIFGHVVKQFFPEVVAKHGPELVAAGAVFNEGLASVLRAAQRRPARSISAATTTSTEPRSTPSCARAPPSTRRSRPCDAESCDAARACFRQADRDTQSGGAESS